MGVGFQSVSDESIRHALQQRGITGNIDEAISMGHGNPAVVESLLQQGTIAMLELALKWMRALGADSRWFSKIAIWCESLTREDALDLMHWLRLLSRDMMALKCGATIEQLQVPMHKTVLLELLPHWPMAALAAVAHETLRAEQALRLHIKIALVMDGLSIALHDAREEV